MKILASKSSQNWEKGVAREKVKDKRSQPPEHPGFQISKKQKSLQDLPQNRKGINTTHKTEGIYVTQ
jgi:hypothetical protein